MNEKDLPPTVVTLPCRYGTLSFLSNDDPIGRSLIDYGEWAEHEIQLLSNFINPGDVVIDVGANIGTHTIAFASFVGKEGMVYSFEPQAVLFTILAMNVRQNGLEGHVRLHNYALGSRDENMLIPLRDYSLQGNFGAISLHEIAQANDGQNDYCYETVQVVCLDDLGIHKVSLVKIDVEGMERLVIEGAKNIIHSCRPVIYTECNDIQKSWELISFLKGIGYLAYYFLFPAYNESNFRRNERNFFGVAHESGLLFINEKMVDRFDPRIMANPNVKPIKTLEELAQFFLETPRFGDKTEFDRSPMRLKQYLSEAEKEIDSLKKTSQRLHEDIVAFKEEIRKRDELISQLTHSLNKKDREMFLLQDQIRHLTDVTSEQASTISHLQQTVTHENWSSLGKPTNHSANQATRVVDGFGRFLDHVPIISKGINTYRSWLSLKEQMKVIRDSDLFDVEYYLNTYPDVTLAGVDPLRHFVEFGGIERRNPSEKFDTAFYLDNNPDVATAGLNPLYHFVKYGAKEGRMPRSTSNVSAWAEEDIQPIPNPTLPSENDWISLFKDRGSIKDLGTPVQVDIVVPVYRGLEHTLSCIYSVLKSKTKTSYELVVINDASPDPELVRELHRLKDMGLITLLENPQNQGFVKSTNKGIALHPERDVVLLNSDTQVFGDWLDRLRSAAYRRDNIGTVTPLSNNATICSYPYFRRANNMALEIEFEELDNIAAEVNCGIDVEIPTAVGFCMYIRSDCLNEVGPFDEERFGRGYGEENDFCLRAAEFGWKHVLAGDVFVLHYESVSFGQEKHEHMRRALKTLAERYPSYESDVQQFIKNDPVLPVRQRLDLARLHKRTERRAILFVTHNWGGGTERHVQEMANLLREEGSTVMFLRPTSDPNRISLSCDTMHIPNVSDIDVRDGVNQLSTLLKGIGIRHIHVHHLAGFHESMGDLIRLVAQKMSIPYDITIHDYTSICPRINLIDGSGIYCGEPPETLCSSCIKTNGSPFGDVVIWKWRDMYLRLLKGARRIYVPSCDVRQRLQKYFSDVEFTVMPHEEIIHASVKQQHNRRDHDPREIRRIALIGAIGPHKGSKILEDCARNALERELPIHFVVIGYTDRDSQLLQLPNVTITGPYQEKDVFDLLSTYSCDLAWFPAVCPETYSYTLSIAFKAALYPVVFDIGAPAERLREIGWGAIMPLEFMKDPKACNDFLVDLQISYTESVYIDKPLNTRLYPNVIRDYYNLSWDIESTS